MVLALLQTGAVGSAGTPTNQSEAGNQASGYLATIIQSRSTNTRGYKVIIRKDGSATAEVSGGAGAQYGQAFTENFPAGTIDVNTLEHLLQQVGDVSSIQAGFCAKSVSFGTRTQIEYDGKTSGDLQCVRPNGTRASPDASRQLSEFVLDVLGKLKINVRRVITAP